MIGLTPSCRSRHGRVVYLASVSAQRGSVCKRPWLEKKRLLPASSSEVTQGKRDLVQELRGEAWSSLRKQ